MDPADKEHILRTNQYYIAQVSSMEIKISELKAQLHAKDFEIDYLTSKLSPSKSVYDKSLEKHDVEIQLSILLQENQALKKQLENIEDTSILKSQLEHALYMKDIFEQKYRDLNLQGIISEKHAKLESEKDETIKTLKFELEQQKMFCEEHRNHLESLHEENSNLKQEVIERNKQIQELRKKTFQISQIEKEKKEVSSLKIPPPSQFFRPNSSSQSRKFSPEVKKSNIRNNFQYTSPKLNSTTPISRKPKIVSISLESTISKLIT